MVSAGFRYAVSCNLLLTSSSLNLVFSKISASGRKLIFVPVAFVHFRSPEEVRSLTLTQESTLVTVMVDHTLPADLYIHIFRKSIDYRRTDSMQTTTCLVCGIVEFSSRMQCGKYQTCCRNSFFMHSNRHSPSVIFYGTGTICL